MNKSIKTSHGIALLVACLFLAIILVTYASKKIDTFTFSIQPNTQLAQISGSGSQLVARYTFDEGSGISASDSEGGNSGTLTNGPTWTSGNIGGGVAFDGNDDYVSVPDSGSLDITGSGTVSTWVKLSAINRWNSLYAKGSANNDVTMNYALEINTSNQAICLIGNGSAANYVTSGTSVPANQFVHILCTWDGSSLKLYINGSLSGSGTQSITPQANSSPLFIGQYGGNADQIQGVIDDFRVYNRAFSGADVTELYAFTESVTPPPGPSDSIPPTVSISSPSGTVSGTVSVTASASDNVGVAGVQFKIDGSNLASEDTSSPYSVSWDTSTVSNGAHTITATARDAAGNTAVSSGVSVIVSNVAVVPDVTAPTVPTNISATAVSSSAINISWTASTDPVVGLAQTSGLSGYRIYRNSTQIGTAATNSYSDSGLTASTQYSYTVSAYDVAGNNSSQSSSVSATTQAVVTPPAGTTFFVRPGATGNGSSWVNAWGNPGSIVWASLVPGTTLCIAGGSYSQSLIVGSNGTASQGITVKRARASDSQCGSSTSGWNSSYDAQVILPSISVTTSGKGSYVTIDGVVDNGIKVVVPNPPACTGADAYCNNQAGIRINSGPTGLTLKYLEVSGPGGVNAFFYNGDLRGIDSTGSLATNGLVISHVNIHGFVDGIFIGVFNNGIIEYSTISDLQASNSITFHENVLIGNGGSNVIFRYNKIWNWASEGILLCPSGACTVSNWYIYGNTFYGTGGSNNRVLEVQKGSTGPFYMYNNTFINSPIGIRADQGGSFTSNSESKNNIFWNTGSAPFSSSNNLTGSGASTPFVSYTNGDYRLTSSATGAINKGATLTNDGFINNDLDGNTRGADGTWDIGAYEYTGTTLPPTTYTVTATKSGTGSGTITGTGVSCVSNTCTATVNIGSTLVLTATPATGSAFTGWSNGCTGTSTCIVSTTSSPIATFTSTADTTSPSILNITVPSANITSSSALVRWNTDELTTSRVQYGLTIPGYGSFTAFSALTTSPSFTLSGLAANTVYHYRVISTDGANNVSTSLDGMFSTLPNPVSNDTDGDGVLNANDKCGNTPSVPVNSVGCPLPRLNNFTVKPTTTGDLNSASFDIGNTSYGKVTFTNAPLVKSDGNYLDVDSYLTIAQALVTLNSTLLPELNRPATITLYNLTLTTPKILKDGVVCSSSVCTGVSYNASTKILSFNVPSFSTYSIIEGTDPTPSTNVITVSKSGSGSGTVSATGVSCGSDCSGSVTSGSSITLTASASSGSTFTGWSGGYCSGTGACTFSPTQDSTVIATFTVISSQQGGGGGGNTLNTPPPNVLGISNTNNSNTVPGCTNRTSGFSSINGQPCTGGTSAPGAIPGCDNRTVGFSRTTGQTCVGNTGTTVGGSSIPYNFGTVTLRDGSRGAAVMELQRFLNQVLNLGLVIDGKLGPKTIAVIKKWQIDNGLVPDGLVGTKTKAKMNAVGR